ncbi:MAG: DUF6325 family protein [Actinomycetes bacterium]
MSDLAHVHGPVDYLIIEFQAERANGSMVEAVLDLVDRGIIRLYDVLVIEKDADGTFSGVELTDLAQDHLGGIAAFAGARSGLLGDDDLAEAANAVAPGAAAAVLVYENTWAIPFVAAAHSVGAEFVAGGRIAGADLMTALDALEGLDG